MGYNLQKYTKRNQMLKKLLHIKQAQQQSKYLSQLINATQKNSQHFLGELNEQLLQSLQVVVHRDNFQLWVELVITLLSIQETFSYADSSNKVSTPLLTFLDYLGALQVPDKLERIYILFTKYTTTELSLVFHSLIVKYCVIGTSDSKIPRLLSVFIRISSFIIEKYIQLKNQPAKGTQDRMQDDKVLLKSCQKWVANNLSIFLKRIPASGEAVTKEIVLIAVCDVIGALLQTNKQNILNSEISGDLLENNLLSFILKNYEYNEIQRSYFKFLHQKKFNNPIKKIQIPQVYTPKHVSKTGLNTQAFTFLTVRYVNLSLSSLCTQSELIKVVVPALSQILQRHYEIKIQALGLMAKLLSRVEEIKIVTGYEYGYPIQLFLFYLYNFEHQSYCTFRKKVVFENNEAAISSLVLLKRIYLQSLEKEKQKYILQTILENKISSRKVFVILNQIPLKQQKTERQSLLLDVAVMLKEQFSKQAMAFLKKCSIMEGLPSSIQEKLDKICL